MTAVDCSRICGPCSGRRDLSGNAASGASGGAKRAVTTRPPPIGGGRVGTAGFEPATP